MSPRTGLAIGLTLLLLLLQWPLWFAKGGWFDMRRLESELRAQRAELQARRERNARLESEIRDLAEGEAAAESIARRELGMIRKDEMFIQFVPRPSASAAAEGKR